VDNHREKRNVSLLWRKGVAEKHVQEPVVLVFVFFKKKPTCPYCGEEVSLKNMLKYP
jgi:hypothetical protein